MVNRYNIRMSSYAVFNKLLNSNMLLLVFDGFDEMATKSSKRITIENFRRIADLARGQTKMLLTCRTHYFRTRVAERELLKGSLDMEIGRHVRSAATFDIMYLREFEDDQIRLFLKRHTSKWRSIWSTIGSTYNLGDLAKRPVLLEMILKTVSAIKAKKDINICDLYKFYTDIWIEREDWHSVMTLEGKRLFMENLAYRMHKESDSGEDYAIHYSKLPTPIREHFREDIVTRDDLDYYDHDTRTCSFLNRTAKGNYKFIHKSFMEYFLACRVAHEVSEGSLKILEEVRLSKEIAAFLLPMFPDDKTRVEVMAETHVKHGWVHFGAVFGWDQAPKDALVKTLTHPESKGPERAKAAYYLGKKDAGDQVELLLRVLESDSYLYGREMAAVALARLSDASIIPDLQRIHDIEGFPDTVQNVIQKTIQQLQSKRKKRRLTMDCRRRERS